jgi:hypothetical protein
MNSHLNMHNAPAAMAFARTWAGAFVLDRVVRISSLRSTLSAH